MKSCDGIGPRTTVSWTSSCSNNTTVPLETFKNSWDQVKAKTDWLRGTSGHGLIKGQWIIDRKCEQYWVLHSALSFFGYFRATLIVMNANTGPWDMHFKVLPSAVILLSLTGVTFQLKSSPLNVFCAIYRNVPFRQHLHAEIMNWHQNIISEASPDVIFNCQPVFSTWFI